MSLHLFSISHFSSTCCTKNFSLISCSTMAKRIQDQEEEARVVSKSRPAEMNMFSFISKSSSAAWSPIASKSPVMPTASGKPDSRMSVEPSSFDAASTSQVRLKHAYLGGLMEKQRRNPSHREEEDSEDSDSPADNKAWRKPLAHGASSSVDQERQQNTETTWDHYLHISPDTSHFSEAVFSIVRKIFGRKPGDPMEDLNVNLAIWRMFVNTTLRAAVLLGKDYDAKLRYVKNHLWKTTGQLFRETEKLISGQTETTGISLINFQDLRSVSTSLLHSRPYQYSTAKVYVFSDSVICSGIELMDSQWSSCGRFSQDSPTVAILIEIQQMMGTFQYEPENFTGRIIFMSMFNDIVWDAKGHDELCVKNSKN